MNVSHSLEHPRQTISVALDRSLWFLARRKPSGSRHWHGSPRLHERESRENHRRHDRIVPWYSQWFCNQETRSDAKISRRMTYWWIWTRWAMKTLRIVFVASGNFLTRASMTLSCVTATRPRGNHRSSEIFWIRGWTSALSPSPDPFSFPREYFDWSSRRIAFKEKPSSGCS